MLASSARGQHLREAKVLSLQAWPSGGPCGICKVTQSLWALDLSPGNQKKGLKSSGSQRCRPGAGLGAGRPKLESWLLNSLAGNLGRATQTLYKRRSACVKWKQRLPIPQTHEEEMSCYTQATYNRVGTLSAQCTRAILFTVFSRGCCGHGMRFSGIMPRLNNGKLMTYQRNRFSLADHSAHLPTQG